MSAPSRFRRAVAGLGLAAALAGATHAGADVNRAQPPALGPAPALRLPAVQTQRLANGLEIDVVEMHEAPVVDATLILKAGSVFDPPDVPGLATFAAEMLDEGAGKRGSLEISEQADFLGATFGSGAGYEISDVGLHVSKRRFADGLDLMADVVLRPTFPDSEIARQLDQRRTALLQLRDQPTAIAPLAFNAIVFGPAHPYGRPMNGNDASTEKIDRAAVVRFWQARYRPNNARLLIVGDITPSEAKALVSARFGAWTRGDVTPPPVATPPAPQPRAIYLVDKPGAAQSVLRIGHVGVARSTPDFAALEVLNTLLGGSFTSRLNQNLRETHGYTYGAGSLFDMRRMAGPFRASASVVTAKTDSSVIEFLRELRRVRDERVPESEMEKTRAYLALGFPSDFETTSGASGRYLELLANDLPLDTWQKYIGAIQAVTAEDVQRAAQRYLDPDHFAIVVVGDRSVIESGLRALHEGPIVMRDLWGAATR